MHILIQGGRVIDPAHQFDAVTDLYVAVGRVAGLGQPPAGFKAERVIDALGRIVCPGLIDLCARLREPGLEHKATIASETRAAATAGITTLICPPDTGHCQAGLVTDGGGGRLAGAVPGRFATDGRVAAGASPGYRRKRCPGRMV